MSNLVGKTVASVFGSGLSVGLSVSPWKKYTSEKWNFVYKLNILQWKPDKGAYVIPNVGLSVFWSLGCFFGRSFGQSVGQSVGKELLLIPNIGRSVHYPSMEKNLHDRNATLFRKFTAGAYGTFARVWLLDCLNLFTFYSSTNSI